jgi:hypothetical protein
MENNLNDEIDQDLDLVNGDKEIKEEGMEDEYPEEMSEDLEEPEIEPSEEPSQDEVLPEVPEAPVVEVDAVENVPTPETNNVLPKPSMSQEKKEWAGNHKV